jgi:uncharacterized damage-inducible protein DinB
VFTLEYARMLYDFNAWANRRLLDACAALTPEQFTRPMGSSFSSVRDTLAHILGAEWLWLERWHGRSHRSIPAAAEYADLAAIRRRWEEVERDLLAFVGELSATGLARRVAYHNTAGQPYESEQWELLAHLANHSTYHRGQVITLLRQLGAAAPSTDLIAFYRTSRGEPER